MTLHQSIASDDVEAPTLTGAEIVVRALVDNGVDVLFG